MSSEDPLGTAAISAAADRARARLHEELEQLRAGVEEMLEPGDLPGTPGLRWELEELREEMHRDVRRQLGAAEQRFKTSVGYLDERTRWLEYRIDTVEHDRERTEWRLHMKTEAMLDNVLREMRTVADRLSAG